MLEFSYDRLSYSREQFSIEARYSYMDFPIRNMGTGFYLKKIRLHLGLSQAEVAKALKVGRTTYGRWENEEREMPVEVVEMMADIYRLPACWHRGGMTEYQYAILDLMVAEFTDKVRESYRMNKMYDGLPYHPTLLVIDLLNMRVGNELLKLWVKTGSRDQHVIIQEWFHLCALADCKESCTIKTDAEAYEEELPVQGYDSSRDTLVDPFDEEEGEN